MRWSPRVQASLYIRCFPKQGALLDHLMSKSYQLLRDSIGGKLGGAGKGCGEVGGQGKTIGPVIDDGGGGSRVWGEVKGADSGSFIGWTSRFPCWASMMCNDV